MKAGKFLSRSCHIASLSHTAAQNNTRHKHSPIQGGCYSEITWAHDGPKKNFELCSLPSSCTAPCRSLQCSTVCRKAQQIKEVCNNFPIRYGVQTASLWGERPDLQAQPGVSVGEDLLCEMWGIFSKAKQVLYRQKWGFDINNRKNIWGIASNWMIHFWWYWTTYELL